MKNPIAKYPIPIFFKGKYSSKKELWVEVINYIKVAFDIDEVNNIIIWRWGSGGEEERFSGLIRE